MKKYDWTPEILEILKKKYPHQRTEDLAKEFGFSVYSVYNKAYALGLKKSKEYLSSKASGILVKGENRGKEFWFKKGHIPANKGVKSPGKTNSGSFKKGHISANSRKDGDTRISVDGYIEIRVSARNWKLFHRIVWQQHNGEIPEGMIVAFKDGNKLNCDISNLELITRQESMQRISMHNYPEDLRNLILTRGHLTRQINKKNNETKN